MELPMRGLKPESAGEPARHAMITLALSKGRIFDDALPLLGAAGITVLDDPETSRKLILDTNQPDVRVLVVRATDVPRMCNTVAPTWASPGATPCWSTAADGLYQPLDLQIARCRISVAVREGFDYASAVRQGSRLTVATKYVAIAREFFAHPRVCMST
jgi:ATP phosphoribosyltransferase